jgi:uncharacterized protein YciI
MESHSGGPYADCTGLLVIVEALYEEEVYELFQDDSYVVNEMVRISSIHEWLIFFDFFDAIDNTSSNRPGC